MRSVLALLVLSSLLAENPVTATTIHVAADGSGDQPTIAAAVAVAAPGDVIQLAPGVFAGAGNRDVVVTFDLTVRGSPSHPEDVVIDCQGSAGARHRGFWIDGPTSYPYVRLILEGVTIENGYAPGDPSGGGAVLVDQAELLAHYCLFRHNRADRGGAITMTTPSGQSEVWHSEFRENTAFDQGAAAFGVNISTLHLHWCTVVDNLGGGAFGQRLGGLWLENCTVVGNAGGGFLGHDLGWGAYSLDNCIVAYNAGPSFEDNEELTAYVECTDIYGNSGGNWNVAPLDGQLGVDGNIQLNPQFCDHPSGDLTINVDSPCAPYTPPNPECALIGAHPAACGGVSIEARSWTSVKGLFR